MMHRQTKIKSTQMFHVSSPKLSLSPQWRHVRWLEAPLYLTSVLDGC